MRIVLSIYLAANIWNQSHDKKMGLSQTCMGSKLLSNYIKVWGKASLGEAVYLANEWMIDGSNQGQWSGGCDHVILINELVVKADFGRLRRGVLDRGIFTTWFITENLYQKSLLMAGYGTCSQYYYQCVPLEIRCHSHQASIIILIEFNDNLNVSNWLWNEYSIAFFKIVTVDVRALDMAWVISSVDCIAGYTQED